MTNSLCRTLRRLRTAIWGVLGATVLGSAACRDQREVVVVHAASLSRAFSELAEPLAREHPELRLRFEVSGSLTAARKVSELGMRADVVAVADVEVIERLLMPAYADWTLSFATTELVLVHLAHSRYTDEVTSDNWPAVLSRKDVALGLVRPDHAPLGYRTLQMLTLAESHYRGAPGAEDLRQRLVERCAPEHLMADETELYSLLSARAIDYAFLYRSTAEDHRLKLTRLPDAINLGNAALADAYQKALVEVPARRGGDPTHLAAHPIVFGLTIPKNAPNPQGAALLVGLMAGEAGRKVLARCGFRPLSPFVTQNPSRLPEMLRPLALVPTESSSLAGGSSPSPVSTPPARGQP